MREGKLVPRLEEWLLGLLARDQAGRTLDALVDATQPSLGDATRRAAVLRRLSDAEERLAQYKAALGADTEPALVTAWINEAMADLARARKDLAALNGEVPEQMGREELAEVSRAGSDGGSHSPEG